jgi:hypothetical protein
MIAKGIIRETLLNTRDISSVRLPKHCMTHPQKYFRHCIYYPSASTWLIFETLSLFTIALPAPDTFYNFCDRTLLTFDTRSLFRIALPAPDTFYNFSDRTLLTFETLSLFTIALPAPDTFYNFCDRTLLTFETRSLITVSVAVFDFYLKAIHYLELLCPCLALFTLV